MDIDSESRLIWKLIKEILLTPFKIILLPFRKYTFVDLFAPVIHIYEFLMQSKFTMTVIIINIMIFALELIYGEPFIRTFSTYPTDLMDFSRYFSFITAGFLHYGFAHLIGNMIVLFIFGRAVERKLGTMNTFLGYFGALVIGNVFADLMYLFLKSDAMLAGASGAIMGLVSLGMLLTPFQITFLLIVPAPLMILAWLYLLTDLTGVLGNVDDGVGHFAHLGGFISVSIIYFFFSHEDRSRLKKGLIINLISIVLITAVYYFFIRN